MIGHAKIQERSMGRRTGTKRAVRVCSFLRRSIVSDGVAENPTWPLQINTKSVEVHTMGDGRRPIRSVLWTVLWMGGYQDIESSHVAVFVYLLLLYAPRIAAYHKIRRRKDRRGSLTFWKASCHETALNPPWEQANGGLWRANDDIVREKKLALHSYRAPR